MNFSVYMAALTLLVAYPLASGYCDTLAKSRRDCILCKVDLKDATQEECEPNDVDGPCFWNDSSDVNPYADWTDKDCKNGGDNTEGGGGDGTGGSGGAGGGPGGKGPLRRI